jgi:hypothetical protein
MLLSENISQPQVTVPAAHHPILEPGHAYRTEELAGLSGATNPSRLARRLVDEGLLEELAHGLYASKLPSRFGPLPPGDEEVMRAFLKNSPFLFTGPERWNALGLGATAMFRSALVYNTKRSGEFTLGRRHYELRRVPFPAEPTPEWFVVDLIENHQKAGVSRSELERALSRALAEGRFRIDVLREAARQYGTRATQSLVDGAADGGTRP